MRISSAGTHAAGNEVDAIFDPSRQQPALKRKRRNDNSVHNSYNDERKLPEEELIETWRGPVSRWARPGPEGPGPRPAPCDPPPNHPPSGRPKGPKTCPPAREGAGRRAAGPGGVFS